MVSFISNVFKNKVLFHMGCKDCGNEEAYFGVKVLNKLGIEVEAKEGFQCGCEYFGTDESKIEALARENQKMLEEYTHVVVGCARCFHVMKKYYDVELRHVSQVLYKRLITADPGYFRGSGDIYYHDPCYLTRFEKIMDEPRKVLRILGYNVKEFDANRERTDCCGAYSPLRILREKTAEIRLDQLPSTASVTAACPKCTENLAAFNKPNSKITVKNFLDLVDYALNIEIPPIY